MQEALIALSMLARRFRIQIPPNHPVEIEPHVTLRPKGGLPASIELRSRSSWIQKYAGRR